MRSCLVLGSAMCLWEDVEAALRVGEYDAVLAVKLAGIAWPGELYSWVTLHPEWMHDYLKRRKARGYPAPREVVAEKKAYGVTRIASARWPEQKVRSGASGFFGVKVALDDGFDRVVLCGIPMEQQIGRIDGRDGWPAANTYRPAVLAVKDRIKDRVRSMSGWTAEQFGKPDPAWLLGRQPEASALTGPEGPIPRAEKHA